MTQPLVQCVWPLGAELGEGPVWMADQGALFFVDIKGKKLHRFRPGDGEQMSWAAPQQIGFAVPTCSQQWLCGLSDGLYTFDPSIGRFDKFFEVESKLPGNRLNDGFVDPFGRLWFGSMDDSEALPTGVLYRMEADARLFVEDEGYVITNGPAMSPDGRTLSHTDTLKRVIYAFDVDPQGRLRNPSEFLRIRSTAYPGAYPDGMAVDAEGCLWVALFGGWGIHRYSPSGEFLASVRFPCANVTKLAFGGDDLCTVFATTAWKGLSDTARSEQALAGGLFSFRVSTPGLPQALCAVPILQS